MLKTYILFRQVQAIGEGGKVAQRLNKGHVLIVLNGADAVQPRAPNLNLFEEPLIGLRLAAITIDHHLLRQAAAVRTEHRVQAKNRALMRRQHRLQRLRFHRGKVNQNAIRRKGRQPADRLHGGVNRYADDNHAGIGDDIRRPGPIVFFQNTHLVAGQR